MPDLSLVCAYCVRRADDERRAGAFDLPSGDDNRLVNEVEGLSDAQLNFKPKPDAWSVLMVVEHLTIAEPQYWQWLQDALKQPATDKPAEAKDGDILWYGIDRTQRSRTAEAREAKVRAGGVLEATEVHAGAGSYHR